MIKYLQLINKNVINKKHLFLIHFKKYNFIKYSKQRKTYYEIINEEYENVKRLIPLNENEILNIRNILIEITNEKIVFDKIVHQYNIAPFFLLNVDIRNDFLNFLQNDLNNSDEIRKMLMNDFNEGSKENINAEINTSNNQIDDFVIKKYKKILTIFHDFIKNKYYKQYIFYEHLKNICDFSNIKDFIKNRKKIKNRKLYLYVGPTNSGKTYEALKRLMNSNNGIYFAPLRLLAWEVYKNLLTNNKITNLLTGQEIIKKKKNSHTVCTIEMAPLNKIYDCALIDEIQMIQDNIRGFAWTNVLIHLDCNEIFLCGSEYIVDLIKNLSDVLNDQLIIKRFKRLSDLELENNVEKLENVKTGDCIITFSRNNILLLKRKLEKMNKRVFVLYGSLPPECKKKQIELFNYYCENEIKNEEENCNQNHIIDISEKELCIIDKKENIINNNEKENIIKNNENNKKETILIATDVIGMGINILIKRIIFYSLKKYDGDTLRYLNISEILQISGRAGRYQTKFKNSNGYITAINLDDLNKLKELFKNKKINQNLLSNNPIYFFTNEGINDINNFMKMDTNEYNNLPNMNISNEKNNNTFNVIKKIDTHLERKFPDTLKQINVYNLRAGYFPNFDMIEKLEKILKRENKSIKLHEILTILIEHIKLNEKFFFLTKNYNQIIYLSNFLKDINIDNYTLFIYALSPINLNNVIILNSLKIFCMSHSLLGFVDFFKCIINDTDFILNSKNNCENKENIEKRKEIEISNIIENQNNIDNKKNVINEIYIDNVPNYIFKKNYSNENENNSNILLKYHTLNKSIDIDEYIKTLEVYYEIIDLYCWLQTKFPNIYKNINLVEQEKERIASEINYMLLKTFEQIDSSDKENLFLKKIDLYFKQIQ